MSLFKKFIFVIVFFLSSYASANEDLSAFNEYPVSSKMEGANFAGYYYVSTSQCGDGLICAEVKNLKTGESISFPNTYLATSNGGTDKFSLEYYANSSLIVISAELKNPSARFEDGYSARYYDFKDDEFKLKMVNSRGVTYYGFSD